jgi:hypothetical protein
MAKVQHLKVQVMDKQEKIKASFPDYGKTKQEQWRQEYARINTTSASTGRAFQKYYIEVKDFYTSQKVSSDCNEISFINTGTTNLTVEGILLVPNQSLRIQGNIGEIDTTQYDIIFTNLVNTGNKLTIIRKLYK